MNSCGDSRQNSTSRSGQSSYRNTSQCSKEGNQNMDRWPLGMTYVPWQEWRDLYPLEDGFHNGTIFKELNLPFMGRRMC